MLFADVVDFGRLTETQVGAFATHFLPAVAELAPASKPLVMNTWGDAVLLVFETASEAGQFALNLDALVTRSPWSEKGLPDDLSLRIGVHAGPVHPTTDPLTGDSDFIGTHMTRAARLVTIAPPGCIYASRAFAALAALEGADFLVCEYVGEQPLPKAAGSEPTFRLWRHPGDPRP